MGQLNFTNPIPPHGGRDRDASFQCSEGAIFIHNQNSRSQAYMGWATAAFLIIFPLVRARLPGRAWIAFDEPGAAGWFGLLVYVFAIFSCVSIGFWWSTIRVDLVSRRIVRDRRWGPFRSCRTALVEDFDRVVLESDSDGVTTVDLVGSQRLRIVWGRPRAESIPLAKEVASRITLPLVGVDE